MKQNLILLIFVFLSSSIKSQDFGGLWKVIANVFDGTTERYDNLYFDVKNDSVDFLIADSIVGTGKISNDTIYVLSGFEFDGIDWIHKINMDSLLSSPTNSKHTDNISYKRINLTGDWEQLNYWWNGGIDRDTCEIVQERDSIYFFSSSDCFATAYLKKDSIIVKQGFEGLGVDFFTMYSNDFFVKYAPLVESIDKTTFIRLGQTVGFENVHDVNNIQVFPNPSIDFIKVVSKDKLIQGIKLYSITGEIIDIKKADTKFVELNISDLSKGIYILEVTINETEKYKQKIMKNN